MTELKFKAGDVVQLQSGGPAMTVEKAINTSAIRCVWITDSGMAIFSSFHQATLRMLRSQESK